MERLAQVVEHTEEVVNAIVYPRGSSWYIGENISGKRRIFTPYAGGVGPNRRICDDIAGKGYEGLIFTS